jgi:hypothetical protein
MTESLTEAQLAAAEARTDSKFERLFGEFHASLVETNCKIEAVAASTNARIDTLNATVGDLKGDISDVRRVVAADRNWVIGTVLGTGVAVTAMTIAALGYGAAQFYNGSVVRDLAHREAQIYAVRPNDGATR